MKKCNWRVRGNSLSLEVHRTVNGKRQRYTKTIPDMNPTTGRPYTIAQRNKLWLDFYADTEPSPTQSVTLSQLIDTHISANPSLSRETVKGYKSLHRRYIKNTLGSLPAEAITKKDIQLFVNDLVGKHSEKTVRNAFGLISAAYTTANRFDMIKYNPCNDIILPRKQRKEPPHLNEAEVFALLEALDKVGEKDYNCKVAVLFILFGGLRKGEVLGLNEEDLDTENGAIKIHRARYDNGGGTVYEKSVKSETSERYKFLPEPIVEEGLRVMELNKAKKFSHPALFKYKDGSPLKPYTLYTFLTRILKENNIRHIGLHGLRHTHATLLMSLGFSVKEISVQLGHADVGITDRYIHLLEPSGKKIANKLQKKYAMR